MPCGFLCCKTVTSSPLHLLPSLIVQGFQTQSPIYAAYSHNDVHIATFIPLFCCLIKIQLVLQRNMILLDQRHNKRWERSNEMCPLDFLCGAYLSIHNQL